MITNDAGEVALAYYQPTQVYVSASKTTTKREYVFVTRYKGVCLAWIHADDVAPLLEMKRGCCGERKLTMFSYANEAQVAIWTNGSRVDAQEASRGCC